MSGPQAVVAIPLWLAVPFYMLYAAVWLAAIVVAVGVVLVILLWHGVASFVCSTPSSPRSRSLDEDEEDEEQITRRPDW